MNKNYFPAGILDSLHDKRQKGRIFRAARLIREQSTGAPHSPQAHSSILKEIELLEDDEKYLKAMQEHADEQEARRQARQQ